MSLRVRELTPRGPGAVSVLAISGVGALEAVRRLSGETAIPTGIPCLVRLGLADEVLDESIVCATSPESVEVHLHGSVPLVRRLIGLLERSAGPNADPVEEAGSIEDYARSLLADASCESAARILLDQADGALARELRSWVARGEAERGLALDRLAENWRIARRALEPAVVVIAGPVNAGKSTLFNALVGEHRAIVDRQPGTTRDLLRERALLGGWPVTLVDTAGEREPGRSGEDPATQASIEALGQDRSRALRRAADLVLWLEPLDPGHKVDSAPPPEAGDHAVLLQTFADRIDAPDRPPHAISALAEPRGARRRVAEVYRATFALPDDPWRPRAPVPFTSELDARIADLRGVRESQFEEAVESILRWRLPTVWRRK